MWSKFKIDIVYQSYQISSAKFSFEKSSRTSSGVNITINLWTRLDNCSCQQPAILDCIINLQAARIRRRFLSLDHFHLGYNVSFTLRCWFSWVYQLAGSKYLGWHSELKPSCKSCLVISPAPLCLPMADKWRYARVINCPTNINFFHGSIIPYGLPVKRKHGLPINHAATKLFVVQEKTEKV